MSSIRRLNSFSLLRNPKGLAKKSIEEFYFPFGPGDMAVMSGSIGKLGEMGGVQGIAGALRTDLKKGLFADEVEKGTYAERKKLYGINQFDKPPLRPFWQHAWEAWNDPILMLLTFSGVFSLIVETIRQPGSGFVEGLAIILAICLVVFVGAFNNLSQEKAFRELEDSTEEESFKVWRDGVQVRVKQSEVVVGDLVELNAGDAVPADGIFVFGDDPATNEAKMTGESKDIPKDAKDPFLLGGTELKRGALFYVVTAVGPNSAYGRIMAALAKPPEDTPLQEKLEGLANTISYIGAAAAILVFIALTAWWAQDVIKNDKAFKDEGTALIDFVIMAITILVVAVPEGLPLAVTLSLAYSMRKMVEDKNLVRVLAACETMGNCTAICSDKTGTLTTNKMTVIRGWIANKFYDKIPVNNVFTPMIKQLLIETIVINSKATEELVDQGGNGAAANNSQEVMLDPASARLQDEPQKRYEETQALAARQPSDGKKTIVEMQQMAHKKTTVWKGNQTEIALLEWLKKYKIDAKKERHHTTIYKNYPFDSMKKNSSVIIKAPSGQWRRCYKGAAEQILATATHIVDEQDREMPIGDYKAHITQSIEAMTKTGLRTIAFAYEDHTHIDPDTKDPNKLADPPAPEKVVFVGTVGIKDPLRAESRASVRTCQRAGVVVRMVTGDHPETAKFIATECGILTAPHHVVMTGEEFRKMVELNPAEAERVIPNLRVLARSSPTDKQVLVKWLKERKHCVAATGDGTNDAPALKEADVGIAMFIAGTAVAKQAAQVLILDDNFASIVKSVMWGRSIFDNIRKFVQFQLTINLVALTLSFIGAVANYPEPLGAVQLLWVNLIMDTLAALALGTEPPTVDLLDRRPYDREGPLINKIMWRNMIGHFVMQLAILLILLFHGAEMFDVEIKETEHYTIIFNTFVWFQIFNEFNARQVTGDANVYHDLFSNKTFWAVSAIIIFFQVLMVEAFTIFARTTHLTAHQWASCVGFGAISLPWGFVVRAIPVDVNDGFIEIPAGTFDGANLEVHEPDELGHPHYKEFIRKRQLEEQGLSDQAAFPDNASPIVPDTVVDVR